jgi:hypothetical protein
MVLTWKINTDTIVKYISNTLGNKNIEFESLYIIVKVFMCVNFNLYSIMQFIWYNKWS